MLLVLASSLRSAAGGFALRRRPRLLLASILAAAFAACSPGRLEVPLPALAETTRSMILALELDSNDSGSGVRTVVALERTAGGVALPFVEELHGGDRVRVTLLEYAESLGELRIGPGEVPRAGGGVAEEPLPANATARRRVHVEDGALSDWESITDLGPPLTDYRIALRPDRQGCVAWRPQYIRLGVQGQVQFVIELGDGTALAGTYDDLRRQYFFRIGEDGEPVPVRVDLTPPATDGPATVRTLIHGAAAPDGELWFTDYTEPDGIPSMEPHGFSTIWRGRIEGNRMSLRPAGSYPEILNRIDVTRTSSAPFEIFGVGVGRRLDGVRIEPAHLVRSTDGASWAKLYDFQTGEDWGPGVAWLGPGEAAAVKEFARPAALALVEGGAVHASAPDGIIGLTAVANAPGIGIVAAAEGGRFFVTDGQRWDELAGNDTTAQVYSIVPFRSGFVFGTASGHLGHWISSEQRFCRSAQAGTATAHFLARVGEHVLMGTSTTVVRGEVVLTLARAGR